MSNIETNQKQTSNHNNESSKTRENKKEQVNQQRPKENNKTKIKSKLGSQAIDINLQPVKRMGRKEQLI
jgi:hypothetical protein